jgi:hypothetical protein
VTYLWGTIKENVYRSNLHTFEELKENIQKEVFSVSQEELECVNVNIYRGFRDVCTTTESISSICYNLGKFYL